MRTKPEDTEKNGQIIIDAAIKLFSERGYEATNMQDIADEAEISRGPLYYRYKTKTELFQAALKVYAQRAICEYKRIFTQEKHILEILRDNLNYCTRHIHSEPYSAEFSAVRANELHEAIRLAEQYSREIYDIIAESLHSAIERGELVQSTNPRDIVNLLFIFVEGLTVTQKTKLITEREEIDAAIENMLHLIKTNYVV